MRFGKMVGAVILGQAELYAAAGALALIGGAAEAAMVQTLSVSGVIERTDGKPALDTDGLFGPAGADLTGARISVFEQYAPAAFDGAQPCGEACQYYPAKSPYSDLYGALLIVVTVNGIQHTYNSAKAGTVTVSSEPGSSLCKTDLDAVDLNGNQAYLDAQFPAQTTFKTPFPVVSVTRASPLLGFASLPSPAGTSEQFSFKAVKASH